MTFHVNDNERQRRREYLSRLARKYGWTRGAEVGVLVGWTFFYLLDTIPGLMMYAVDSWEDESGSDIYPHQAENKAEFCERVSSYSGRAIKLDMASLQAAEGVPDGSLDFVFLDADHSYEGCKSDILAWLPKLKPDGWITGHDYNRYPGVRKAVDEVLGPVICAADDTDEVWARPVKINRQRDITVCCLKQGGKYGANYVNRLYRMVQKNVHLVGIDFLCFTDDPKGIDPCIKTTDLPYDAEGWWGKMGLYKEYVPGVHTNRIMFLDLDVVITGDLDEMLEMETDFALMRDYPSAMYKDNTPRGQQGNSSVILLTLGTRTEIWDGYLEEESQDLGDGDQEFINEWFPGSFDIIPEEWVQSYKLHELEDDVPAGCMVVVFHGKPKPHECGGWVEKLWGNV